MERYTLDRNSEGYADDTAYKAIRNADRDLETKATGGLKMKGEDLEQATLIQWCNLQSCKYSELKLIFAIPNGGYRNKAEARKLKATGTKSGVPDLFLPVPRSQKYGLFIEMKVGRNKCTENQKKWIRKLLEQGYEVKVCYSCEEAIQIIKKYLNI
ncbi:VRR-NUC domain-containing protein [Clostridium butyricum]